MRQTHLIGIAALVLGGACIFHAATPSRAAPAAPAEAAAASKVYGEWRIRIKPDKGAEYAKLIQEKGLPLFREAGGRMVGWWTTLVGDLYEHVTIWEYDGLPAFEKAVGFLGKDERFHRFAALRDPLLSGEDSRFLKLASMGDRPALPEMAKMVIHEVHRVPLPRAAAYWKAAAEALPVLKRHGFRCAGPFRAAIGRWSEVTYLWLYDSLAERDAKLAALAGTPDGELVDRLLLSAADEVETRLLLPAAFAY
jgi:hypothetical protein